MAEWTPPSARVDADDWILGRPDAECTILEYGDFECPHCAAARPVLEGLLAERPDLVRLAYRHFPITTSHPHALDAAEAAEAAGAQGKFWDMHDMLFTHQRQLARENLRWYAEVIGLDLGRFDAELLSHVYRTEVQRDFKRGVRDGVNGTPTLFLNGFRYDGPRSREGLLAAVIELTSEPPSLGPASAF